MSFQRCDGRITLTTTVISLTSSCHLISKPMDGQKYSLTEDNSRDSSSTAFDNLISLSSPTYNESSSCVPLISRI